MDRIKARLADIAAERDAAFDRAEKAEGELREAKLTIARYERENSDLAGKVGRLEEQLDDATAKANSSGSKTQTAQLAAEEAERRILGVEGEKDAIEKQYETLKQKYEKVQADLSELETQLGGL